MHDFQPELQYPSIPFTLITTHQPPAIHSFSMNAPSDNLGPLFQNGRDWDLEIQGDTIDIPFRTVLGGHSFNDAPHMTHSSLESMKHPLPLDTVSDISAPPAKFRRVVKYRPILSKPVIPSQVAETSESKKPSSRGSKKACRLQDPRPLKKRLNTSSVDKKGACGRCFVNHKMVSTNPLSHT